MTVAYPLTLFLCQFQASSIIFSKESNSGFHPSTLLAFSLLAIKTAGSPLLLGSSTAHISKLVTFLATSITSLTEYPFPLPKLNISLLLPFLNYSKAL